MPVYWEYAFRSEDADTIFNDAQALNLTEETYAWIVTEQALNAQNVPVGKNFSSECFCNAIFVNFFTLSHYFLKNSCES